MSYISQIGDIGKTNSNFMTNIITSLAMHFKSKFQPPFYYKKFFLYSKNGC